MAPPLSKQKTPAPEKQGRELTRVTTLVDSKKLSTLKNLTVLPKVLTYHLCSVPYFTRGGIYKVHSPVFTCHRLSARTTVLLLVPLIALCNMNLYF
jgi:hypothetical protein